MKYCCFLFLLFGFSAFAQDRQAIQTDSLLQVIEQSNNDSIKANNYALLGGIWQATNFQKSVKYLQLSLEHAQQYGKQDQEVGVMLGLAYAYMSTGNAAASIDVLQRVLPLVKDTNLDQYGMTLNFISQNYLNLSTRKGSEYSN
jgi:hypothetical protein